MTEERKTFITPFGRISYPYLLDGQPNQQGDLKWTASILVTPEEFQSKCGDLLAAIDDLGKSKFGKTWSLKTATKKCIQRTDEMTVTDERTKGLICIKTTANRAPLVVGPDKKPWSPNEIKSIRGGHWGRVTVHPFSYNKAGNKGISLNLNILQYWKPDEEFGGGSVTPQLSLLDSIEVPVADFTPGEVASTGDMF